MCDVVPSEPNSSTSRCDEEGGIAIHAVLWVWVIGPQDPGRLHAQCLCDTHDE